MSGIKRERWAETDVLALPAGEHDFFERKSGALLGDGDFRKALAKALSAFANSGGGHIVLGVKNDGSFDGVDPMHRGSRTTTRDWLEQVIPDLVAYSLEDFRVHEVYPSSPSLIPAGKALIVIDVGDSVLAPHQSSATKFYHYRAGGRSEMAPHFYLETLRNRLTGPHLIPALESIDFFKAYPTENGVLVELTLVFRVTNTGRVAAYKWALFWESTSNFQAGRADDIKYSEFPPGPRGSYSGGIPLDTTILPSLSASEKRDIGFFLHPSSLDKEAIVSDLWDLLQPKIAVSYRAVSEINRGEVVTTNLHSLISISGLADQIIAALAAST